MTVLGGGLAACGSTTDAAAEPTPTQSVTTTPPPTTATTEPVVLPACAEVWVAEGTLPNRYAGCLDGGKTVKPDAVRCEYGLKIVRYDGRYYAVPGRVINDVGKLKKSDQYHRAMTSCLG